MSDLGASTWSEADASNSANPPNGFPEGMNPSDVNNSARAHMGADKRFWNRINAIKTTAGTSTAFTLTYDVAASAYYDGEEFSFVVNQDCGAAPTLNINSLGARSFKKFTAGSGWAALAAGDMLANQAVRSRYDLASTSFQIVSGLAVYPLLTTLTNSISGNVALNNTGIYFVGPTINAGSTGTWWASGKVCLQDLAGGVPMATFNVRLWDGTTTIDSATLQIQNNLVGSVSLSGVISNPAGNIRIEVNDSSSIFGGIRNNVSANTKDSTLSALRVA
jgi:hypothetical protein